jgi:hypothetical protein
VFADETFRIFTELWAGGHRLQHHLPSSIRSATQRVSSVGPGSATHGGLRYPRSTAGTTPTTMA